MARPRCLEGTLEHLTARGKAQSDEKMSYQQSDFSLGLTSHKDATTCIILRLEIEFIYLT
jgi:hypothetical protein